MQNAECKMQNGGKDFRKTKVIVRRVNPSFSVISEASPAEPVGKADRAGSDCRSEGD
ncbi:MAG: hypothetical protein IJN88_07825 [Clostridia bacterium]|nr:hypothetical protein [Clostridia bacterium]